MSNPVRELQRLGQSVWFDNISRGLIASGGLQRLIDVGVTGVTSNPTIFEKAVSGSSDYDDDLLSLGRAGKSAGQMFEALAVSDIQRAADLLRPAYEASGGTDGFASLEVNPHLAYDTEGTISEARRLFALLDRPNVMIKVPATSEGMPAIRRLIGEGININVTLIFSLDAYTQVREAYVAGLEDLVSAGRSNSRFPSSVASFFVSRVDTAVDAALEGRAGNGDRDARQLMGRAAVSNAKLAYHDFRATFGARRFQALRDRGALLQRPLWASTSTKNPEYSDLLYVETLIARDTVNTMPDATLDAFMEHGNAGESLESGLAEAESTLEAIQQAGISMDQVTSRLLADGVQAFADSYDQLLHNLEDKKAALLAETSGASPARAD